KFACCGFRREAFYPCYGLAEATLLAAGGFAQQPPAICTVDGRALEQHQIRDTTEDSPGAKKVVGCGRALPDQEIAIVDPQRLARCQDDQVGEIWLRGPSIAQGYWRRDTETRETFAARLADAAETGRENTDAPGTYLRTGD